MNELKVFRDNLPALDRFVVGGKITTNCSSDRAFVGYWLEGSDGRFLVELYLVLEAIFSLSFIVLVRSIWHCLNLNR